MTNKRKRMVNSEFMFVFDVHEVLVGVVIKNFDSSLLLCKKA